LLRKSPHRAIPEGRGNRQRLRRFNGRAKEYNALGGGMEDVQNYTLPGIYRTGIRTGFLEAISGVHKWPSSKTVRG
jgi:hypothetical protein